MINTDPVAFYIFNIPVMWYGIMISAGIIAAMLLAMKREARFELPRDTTSSLVLAALPAAIIFARIYYVVFSWKYFANDPAEIFNIRGGGLAIYGGLIGGIGAGYIFSKVKKLNFLTLADLAAPCLALGQAFGRWGNFFNQEAYGRVIENASMQFFPVGVFINAENAWCYATFFYESVWCLIIALTLLRWERKNYFAKKGDEIAWYALLYAAERFVVEGLRTDSLYIGWLRVSQLLSALIVTAAVIYLLKDRKTVRLVSAVIPAVLIIVCAILQTDTLICLLIAAIQTAMAIYLYTAPTKSLTNS